MEKQGTHSNILSLLAPWHRSQLLGTKSPCRPRERVPYEYDASYVDAPGYNQSYYIRHGIITHVVGCEGPEIVFFSGPAAKAISLKKWGYVARVLLEDESEWDLPFCHSDPLVRIAGLCQKVDGYLLYDEA